jgi:hypothetical protein
MHCNMKRILHIATFLIMTISYQFIFAQNNKEKIEALKVAFIAREVSLTPQEAQVFWPVYNEWQDKLEAIKSKRKEFKRIRENPEAASDKEIEAYLNTELMVRQREAELFKEYNERLRKILPNRKVALLYKAEEEFKKELIKQLKESK